MKALPLHAIVRMAQQALLRNKGLWLPINKVILGDEMPDRGAFFLQHVPLLHLRLY